MKNYGKIFWPLASLLVLADCSSKRAIEATMPVVGVPRAVLDGVLRFTLEYNQGAAFSMRFGPYQRTVLIVAALVVLCILARSYRSITALGGIATAGLALIAGGAVGNLLDRLISARGVVDFIDVGVGASRFYIFNVADAGLSVGVVLLAYALWINDRAIAKASAP